jgi:hypothetical protein
MAKSINMLRDLSRRSEEAISRLVTKDGKTKAGRNKAEPPGHISPKTSFAAFILEAWSFIRGVEPGPKNQKAAAAAELYWNVSTGHVSIEPTKAALKRIVDQEPKSWGEHSLNTIRTVSLLPVDLKSHGPSGANPRQGVSDQGRRRPLLPVRQAANREAAIRRFMWNRRSRMFTDSAWQKHAALAPVYSRRAIPAVPPCWQPRVKRGWRLRPSAESC